MSARTFKNYFDLREKLIFNIVELKWHLTKSKMLLYFYCNLSGKCVEEVTIERKELEKTDTANLNFFHIFKMKKIYVPERKKNFF